MKNLVWEVRQCWYRNWGASTAAQKTGLPLDVAEAIYAVMNIPAVTPHTSNPFVERAGIEPNLTAQRVQEIFRTITPLTALQMRDAELRKLSAEEIEALVGGARTHDEGDKKIERENNSAWQITAGALEQLILIRAQYDAYLTYPYKKLEELWDLWRGRGKILCIRPLKNPDTDRGAGTAWISIPRPCASIFEGHPTAMKALAELDVKDNHLKFDDVLLAWALHADHGFPLRGPEWAEQPATLEEAKKQYATHFQRSE